MKWAKDIKIKIKIFYLVILQRLNSRGWSLLVSKSMLVPGDTAPPLQKVNNTLIHISSSYLAIRIRIPGSIPGSNT